MAYSTVIDKPKHENDSVQSAPKPENLNAPKTLQAAASWAEQSTNQSVLTFKRHESRMSVVDLLELIPLLCERLPDSRYPIKTQKWLHDLGRRVTDENKELIRGYNELIYCFDVLADKL
jgi:hypothetical protein